MIEISTGLFVGHILLFIGGFIFGLIVKYRNTKEKFFLYYFMIVATVLTIIGLIVVLVETEVIKFV